MMIALVVAAAVAPGVVAVGAADAAALATSARVGPALGNGLARDAADGVERLERLRLQRERATRRADRAVPW